ncbi:MAG: formate/nitrite transporter family protein [Acidobacteria bacterium]|nr:formate/nitrite transporter family protein [Acidobacteriota bacterium]
MPVEEQDRSAQQNPESSSESQKDLGRPSAQDIYKQVAENAREELKRTTMSLAISGFAGGIFMGLSALGIAIVLAQLGTSPATSFIGFMFYPLGFIVVILGRAQLFTENTLYPVALVFAQKKHIWHTLRLWATVLPANVLGALTFAALATRTQALKPEFATALAQLGLESSEQGAARIFWSAVMAGWIIATVAWLVSASHSITGSIMVIWTLTFVVGLGHFSHCIAGSGEVLAAVLLGKAPALAYLRWLALAAAGNVCGGIGMVTLLEYGQVIADDETAKAITDFVEKKDEEQPIDA